MHISNRLLLGALLLTACSPATDTDPAPGDLESPAGNDSKVSLAATTQRMAGFAWTPNPSGNQTLGQDWSYNGFGGTTRVQHLSAGRYIVWFDGGFIGMSASVLVSAYDDTPNRCKPANFGANNGSFGIEVRCFTVAGQPVNNRFATWFSYEFSSCGPGCQSAFVLSQQTDRSHTPTSQTWNSASDVNSIRFLDTGRYRVTLHSLDDDLGNAQVTAFGTSSNFCKIARWLRVGDDVQVDVDCFDTYGTPANSLFSLLYMSHLSTGVNQGGQPWSRAYVLADQETSDAVYHPIAKYNWNQMWLNNQVNSARRVQRGRYAVRYYSYPDRNSTNAIVTAYGGTEATYCKPEIWTTYGDGTELTVNCFRPDGTKVNSEFSAVYTAE